MDGESQIAHLAGDLESARQSGSAAFEAMTATGDRSFASTFAVNLGRVLVDLGHLDDAWRYGAIAQDDLSSDDVISQAGGRAVRARVSPVATRTLRPSSWREKLKSMMAVTDYLVEHGQALEDLAHVLHAAGEREEAITVADAAAGLYEAKGATFLADRARR